MDDNKNKNQNNFISNITNNTNNTNNNFNLEDYPLNLLFEIEKLILVEFISIYIIYTILIIDYISTKNYNKYIPNNKFGYYLNKSINFYINTWSKSKNLLLVISILLLIFCVFFSKFFLYFILNY